LNPRPLGPEDSPGNPKDAFGRIWCCLLRQRLVFEHLRSNASVRSQRGMGHGLGQIKIALAYTITYTDIESIGIGETQVLQISHFFAIIKHI